MSGVRSVEISDKNNKIEETETPAPDMGILREFGQAVPASSHTTSPNTVTPCAACKLLRRRCAEECPFSPYFSPHEPHKFAAVHKVFGASNVAKMLVEVDENQRADAASSLVYEANVRLRDPVYGCMGAIVALQQQVQSLQTELYTIRREIMRLKYRKTTGDNANENSTPLSSFISPHPPGSVLSRVALSCDSVPSTPFQSPPLLVVSSASSPPSCSSGSSRTAYSAPNSSNRGSPYFR